MYRIGSGGGLLLDVDELLAVVGPAPAGRDDAAERELVESHLRSVLAASSAASTADWIGVERRIGDGRWLAVGDLGGLGLAIVLGPLLHLVAAGPAVRSMRRLLRFDSGWRPRVITLYARLEGLDRDVFEAVHDLQNRWLIVNFDALADRNYEHAFGQVAPTAHDLIAAVAPRGDPEATAAALQRLTYRGILKSDGERYWIRF